jgi:glycerate 2-kinase
MGKIVIAPDSFKGSLTSPQAASAIQRGLLRVDPSLATVLIPLADGGEGTGITLCEATGGRAISEVVTGPLGAKHLASWYLLGDKTTAVIELAEAAGLTLVPTNKRDPKITTTYGVGELIHHAMRYSQEKHQGSVETWKMLQQMVSDGISSSPSQPPAQINHLIITLGGSATNDGGAGILQALEDLNTTLPPHLRVTIACDVDNPLTGPRGASAVFGPQKGATPEDIIFLDNRLVALQDKWGLPDFPGAGAAGGAAYGLKYKFPQAQIRPGIDIVLDATNFDTHLRDATLIITGEGQMDAQTLGGKAVVGVAQRAKAHNISVVALVGGLGADVTSESLAKAGIHAVFPLTPRPMSLEEAMQNADTLLADATERLMRVLSIDF